MRDQWVDLELGLGVMPKRYQTKTWVDLTWAIDRKSCLKWRL